MSLLQSQLLKLQQSLPQSQVSTVRNASFLFPKTEQMPSAALRLMSLKSLQSLSRINPDFTHFGFLFSEASLDIDRGLMPASENESVKKSLEAFMLLLSPNFLLRPAQLCLEYLVRMYSVHLFEIDALMKCIIPYHGTLPFVSLIKILHLTDNSAFSWLHTIQERRTVVARDFIVNVCRSNFELLEWIGVAALQYAEKGIPHRVMHSFFGAMYLEYLDRVGVDEIGLKRLLSIVVRGLTSTEAISADYHKACLMVLIEALSKMDMREEPLMLLLKDVAVACLNTNRFRDAIVLCVYAYQAQGLSFLPLDLMAMLFPHASNNESAPIFEELKQISQQYITENFCCAMAHTQFVKCLRLCHTDSADDTMGDDADHTVRQTESEFSLLKAMLHQLPHLDKFIGACIPTLFTHASQSERVKQLISIIPVMDARFPKAVDEAMEQIHATQAQTAFYKTFLSITRQTKASVERNMQSKLLGDMQNKSQDVRLAVITEIDAIMEKEDYSPLFVVFVANLLLKRMSAQDLVLLESIANMKHLEDILSVDRFMMRVKEIIEDLQDEVQDAKSTIPALKACFRRITQMSSCTDHSAVENFATFTFVVLSSDLPAAHKALYQILISCEHPLFAEMTNDDSVNPVEKIIRAMAKNLVQVSSLHSLLMNTAKSSQTTSLLALSTVLNASRYSSHDVLLNYLHEALSIVIAMHQNNSKSLTMPKLDAFDASTTEFTLNSNNFAAYTVQHVLLILSKKYSSISMEELLKVHTHQSSPLSEIINQLTTLVFSTSIFDSFAHVELLLQVLNENAPMYLASYLTLQRDESLMLQIVRILSFIVEEQQGKVSFQSLLPPLICVMGLVTTTRQVKSAILILIHFICDSKQKQSIKYNPLGLTLIQSGTAIKLFKSIRKGMNASNQQLSTFHNFKGSVAELANFISSYMKAFNNGVVQMRLLTQLIKFGLHREISHALVESMLLPMLKQVNLGQPFESAEKMSALSDIIHYLINFHIGRRDANERELKLFLRLMAMTSQPGCLEPLAHSNIVEAFSPSYIFGTLLKEKNAKDFYADMNSENKLKFALIVSNILSNEEKGSPLTLVYMDIIQAAQLDVTTVLHLFSRCTNIESQTQLLEMFALTSVQPHPKIISKIFDLMKSFRNGSSQLNGKDQSEKMVDSDDESESSDSDTSDADSSDSDTDSSDSDNESDSPAIERKVKKTISFEDSLFFVTCFNVLHSMISRVADDLKQNPHDNILEQCSESFDLEETMKILSKSNHPQLFHSAMHCVDAMAQIFPSRMLNYVSKIVKIISSSFEENNATAIEISEKLMVRLLPQLTQNADDVFPFLNMLINSFQAIPAFRRLRLYTTLLKSISRKYTFSLIVLFLEKYIEDSMPVYRDFCFELLDYFNAEKQCFCLEQMANYIASIMREPTNAAQIRSNALFGISSAKSSRSEEFIASVVIALAEFAQTYVEQDTFLRRITDSLSSIEEEETRDEYNDVLQQYLLNITALSIATMTDAKHFQYEKKRPDPGKRTTLMHHLRSDKLYKIALDTFAIIQQIMDAKSNAGMYSSLLNPESKLYSQLLGESDDERRNSRIQAKAVDQLNLLLADMSFENSEFLLANADQYSKLVRSISKKVFKRDVPERNLQLCLITVDQLARRFAHLHEAQFARVVPQIVEKIRQSNNMMMDASCALALASICGAPLKNQGESDDKSVTRDVLDQIPVAFEAVVETMIETLRSENGNKSMTLYLNGMLSSLAHMVKYCGMYASPYLNGIIDILLQVSMSAISEQVQGLVHDIIEGLTQHLSVPVLIRPLFQSLSTARRIGSQSMSTLFGILSTLFSSMDTAEATRVSEKVVKFYTQAFNTRFESSKSSLINIDDMDSVEREIVDSFKIFVLKLEEDQFASILKELQKWATSGVELNPMRLRTYYRVITKLSSTLKSLFVPYWNTIITQTVGHLKSTTGSPTAEKKRKRSSTADLQDDMHHMTVYIMDALQDLCLYDESNDVARDEDLLKSIYQTLIDHLLNLSCGTPDDYTERMEHMIPALVALAKIAPQKEWNPIQKTVAQQVTAVLNMDLSESQKSQYLVSAVSTLRALYSETPNFITQLADILPTVSELLEENDPLVQQELSNFIQFLQKESGEDIREYLSRS